MEVGKRYYYIRISVEYIYSPLYVHFVLFQLVVTHDSFVKGKLNVFRCVAMIDQQDQPLLPPYSINLSPLTPFFLIFGR